MDASAARSALELAERASSATTGPDGSAALGQLVDQHAELLAALAWFVDGGFSDESLRLANALYRFWVTKQLFTEGAAWFDRVLEAPGGDAQLRGRAMLHAGFMPFWSGDDARAAELFSGALAAGHQLEDSPLVSQALGGLARVALRTNIAEGRRLAGEALAVSEAAADESGRSNALHLLGVGAQMAGDLHEAHRWMTERLALVRATGNEAMIASEAGNLGMVERQLGHINAADTLVREALQIAERRGDEFTKPFALSGLAAIAAERRQFRRAATLIGAAEAMMEAQRMAWPPDEKPHYERLLAALPRAMGTDDFTRAREAGRLMPTSEAVSLALGRTPGGR